MPSDSYTLTLRGGGDTETLLSCVLTLGGGEDPQTLPHSHFQCSSTLVLFSYDLEGILTIKALSLSFSCMFRCSSTHQYLALYFKYTKIVKQVVTMLLHVSIQYFCEHIHKF